MLIVVYYESKNRELKCLLVCLLLIDKARAKDKTYIKCLFIVVYYKSRKRELKAKLMNESVR